LNELSASYCKNCRPVLAKSKALIALECCPKGDHSGSLVTLFTKHFDRRWERFRLFRWRSKLSSVRN